MSTVTDQIVSAGIELGEQIAGNISNWQAQEQAMREMIAAALAEAYRGGAESMRAEAMDCAVNAGRGSLAGEIAAIPAPSPGALPLPAGERQAVALTDEQIAWARLGPLIDKHQIGISTPRNMVHRNGGPNAGWGDSGFWGGTAWTHGLARRPAVFGKSSALEVVTELAAALAANNLEVLRG